MSDILTMAAQGAASDVMRDMRVRCLYSPYYLSKVVLGNTKMVPHLHHNDLELFTHRWASGVTKQAIEWPRAFYKTTSFTIGCSIWHVLPVCEEDHEYALNKLELPEQEWLLRCAIHDQDATQLMAFETQENSEKKLKQIAYHFEENSLFRTLFPEIARTGEEPVWNSRTLTIRRVGARRKEAEGTFEAIGVGGALQSRHYSVVWEDDLVGENARKSDKVMADTIGWHQRLNGAFENASRATRFLVSNRWGYNDLNSYVRENEPDVVFYTRAAYEKAEDGETLRSVFPEEYSMEYLLSLQNGGTMTPYDFSCQYLNEPRLPGAKELDQSNRHTYTVTQEGTIKCSCGVSFTPSQLNRYMHYDPYNAKGAGSTSCPAIVVVGASSDKHIFVLAVMSYKGSYTNIYDKLFDFNDRWRPRLFTYEDVGHQNMTRFHWEQISKTTEYIAAGHRRPPTMEGVKTGGRSKELRIRESLFPVIENSKFSTRKVMVDLDSQLETFPNKVFSHDYDILDALAQGAPLWRFPESEDTALARGAEEDTYLAQYGKPYTHLAHVA